MIRSNDIMRTVQLQQLNGSIGEKMHRNEDEVDRKMNGNLREIFLNSKTGNENIANKKESSQRARI